MTGSYQIHIGKHTVRRLHQLWDLPLICRTQVPPPSPIRQVIEQAGARIKLSKGLTAIRPARLLYTDFTELVYADGANRAYLMPLLDHVVTSNH